MNDFEPWCEKYFYKTLLSGTSALLGTGVLPNCDAVITTNQGQGGDKVNENKYVNI